MKGTVSIGGRTISNLRFADDINGFAGEEEELAKLVEHLNKAPKGVNRPGVYQVPEDSGELRRMEETGCEIICGAPTTLAGMG